MMRLEQIEIYYDTENVKIDGALQTYLKFCILPGETTVINTHVIDSNIEERFERAYNAEFL
jgi:hypothetical protein